MTDTPSKFENTIIVVVIIITFVIMLAIPVLKVYDRGRDVPADTEEADYVE